LWQKLWGIIYSLEKLKANKSSWGLCPPSLVASYEGAFCLPRKGISPVAFVAKAMGDYLFAGKIKSE
jgi:hypothetical protein